VDTASVFFSLYCLRYYYLRFVFVIFRGYGGSGPVYVEMWRYVERDPPNPRIRSPACGLPFYLFPIFVLPSQVSVLIHLTPCDSFVFFFGDLRMSPGNFRSQAETTDVFYLHKGQPGMLYADVNYEILLRGCNSKLTAWSNTWQQELVKGNILGYVVDSIQP